MPTPSITPAGAVQMRLPRGAELTDEQFFEFCVLNRDLRIEKTADGEIILMAPASSQSGARNHKLSGQLYVRTEKDGTGIAFDSSAGFKLPNGAMRVPDAAWIRRERLAGLTPEEKKRFLPLCPDFATELRSPTDRLASLKDKMREYVENGLRLGWLIDPEERQAFVYRADGAAAHLEHPEALSGENVLPGFRLDLAPIWDVGF